MFDRGYLEIGRWHGAPVRVHWTMPVGAVVFSGMRIAPVFWVAFFVIVLCHELGHALMVRHYRHRLLSLDITGMGGLCRWAGTATVRERSLIAWGGVLAQGVLLALTVAVRVALGPPTTMVAAELNSAFIQWNVSLMLLNLVPVPPFDGQEAWPLFRQLAERRRGKRIISRMLGARSSPKANQNRPVDTESREFASKLERLADEARRARRGR